jgi:hypothetical protein
MDNHVVIDFPKKKIIINAYDKESATVVDLVNEGRHSDHSIDKVINLVTAELPLTPQLDRIVNPSIPNTPSLVYNGRLPEENLCPNQMTVEETTFCDEVYCLFRWNTEDTNNGGKAKRVGRWFRSDGGGTALSSFTYTLGSVYLDLFLRMSDR